MGVILSATDSLNWYANLVGKSAEQLTQHLGKSLHLPSDVTFLPYLAGERTPHNDASIRGAFIGISHHSNQHLLTQAVLEGVSFAIRDNLVALQAAGTEISRLTAVGGGSQSSYWLKTLATVLQIPIDVPTAGDLGGAFGAARLALIAATNSNPLDVCTAPTTQYVIDPDVEKIAAYNAAYQTYRKLYPAIKAF